MNTPIQIEKNHWDIICSILKDKPLDIFAFGSRARGNAKKLSDLDLVIKSPITQEDLIELKNLFEESNLPYKVDIVVWDQISTAFQNHVEKDLVKILSNGGGKI